MREVAERESGNRLKDNRGPGAGGATQMRGLWDAVDVGNGLTASFYQRLLTVNPSPPYIARLPINDATLVLRYQSNQTGGIGSAAEIMMQRCTVYTM